jgi:hypothetical protein
MNRKACSELAEVTPQGMHKAFGKRLITLSLITILFKLCENVRFQLNSL